VGVICGLGLFAIFQTHTEAPLRAMGAGPDAIERTLAYARWQGANLLLLASLTVQSAAIRASGDTMRPLVIQAVGQAVHLALLPPLIRGWGGAPGLGVTGAGIASFAGLLTAAALMHVAWIYRLRLRGQVWGALRPHAPTLRLLVRVGAPALGERIVVGLGQALYIRSTAGLGTVVYAAHQIVMMITTNIYAITHGFSVAATVVAAQNLGAGQPEAAERGVRACVRMNVWISSAVGVLLALSLHPLAVLFTADARVAELVVGALIFVALYQPVLGPGGGFVGAFQGAGDTRWPMLIALIGLWGVRLPVVYLCAYGLGWGLTGSWVAMAGDLYLRAALATWRFRLGAWKRASARQPLRTAPDAAVAAGPPQPLEYPLSERRERP
jgi:putative MATE family efflux protein